MNREALDRGLEFIRAWLELRAEQLDIPGFVVAVLHEGQIVLNAAYGYADVERRVDLRPDHLFRVASHSKTFTATAVMLLVEAGQLRLEDPASAYLPWLKDHDDARWARVTLRQLMTHAAGVIRDGLDQDYWQLERPFPDHDRFQREILETGLILDSNTQMKYSNYGYTLLGRVIEQVSGQSYHTFVTERIIEPGGLHHTYPEYHPGLKDGLVTGYTRRELKSRRPLAHISTHAMAPATGFCSTAEDLCRYFAGHMVGSGALLSDESKREMQRVQWPGKGSGASPRRDYGLGLIIEESDRRRLIGHSGGFPGFITNTKADPDEGLVVSALTNCTDGPAGNLVAGIYKILDHFRDMAPSTGVDGDLVHLTGEYRNLWGITHIVAAGDTLVSVSPDNWEPFQAAESLEPVEDHVFQVTKADPFSAPGELVRFHCVEGRVETVSYTGATMWPKAAWLAKQLAAEGAKRRGHLTRLVLPRALRDSTSAGSPSGPRQSDDSGSPV
jgi:D-alanyl-D-alanine carboxypeptidase